MSRITGNTWALLVIALFSILLIINSLKLEFYATKVLPILVCVFVLILTLADFITEIVKIRTYEAKHQKSNKTVEENEDIKKYISTSLWLLGYFSGIFLIGFIPATPLFVGGYMKQHGSPWVETIVTTVVFSVIFYFVFNIVLSVDLYQGQLLNYIGI